MQRVGGAHYHASGKRKHAVEPCVEYRTAVDFGIELDDAALCVDLSVRLDAEPRTVAVGGYDFVSGHRVAAGDESEYSRIVFGYVISSAGQYLPRIGGIEAHITCGVKNVGHGFHRQKVDGRIIEKFK